MSGFLDRLAARTTGSTAGLVPRAASRFEAAGLPHTEVDVDVVQQARGPERPPAAASRRAGPVHRPAEQRGSEPSGVASPLVTMADPPRTSVTRAVSRAEPVPSAPAEDVEAVLPARPIGAPAPAAALDIGRPAPDLLTGRVVPPAPDVDPPALDDRPRPPVADAGEAVTVVDRQPAHDIEAGVGSDRAPASPDVPGRLPASMPVPPAPPVRDAPTVHVSIGRIVVRPAEPTPAPPRRTATPHRPPAVGLDDYLRRADGRR